MAQVPVLYLIKCYCKLQRIDFCVNPPFQWTFLLDFALVRSALSPIYSIPWPKLVTRFSLKNNSLFLQERTLKKIMNTIKGCLDRNYFFFIFPVNLVSGLDWIRRTTSHLNRPLCHNRIRSIIDWRVCCFLVYILRCVAMNNRGTFASGDTASFLCVRWVYSLDVGCKRNLNIIHYTLLPPKRTKLRLQCQHGPPICRWEVSNTPCRYELLLHQH